MGQRLPQLRVARRHSVFVNPLTGPLFNNQTFQRNSQSIRQYSVRDSLLSHSPPLHSSFIKSNHQLSKLLPPRLTLSKPQIPPSPKSYRFPLITVTILNPIRYTSFKICLQEYFEMFFSLQGPTTHEFISHISPFVRKIARSQREEDIHTPTHTLTPLTLSTKKQLINTKLTQSVETQQALIHRYCIPNRALQESCLRDLLLECSAKAVGLNESYSQVVFELLDHRGIAITSILDIEFEASVLYIGEANKGVDLFQRYKAAMDQRAVLLAKSNFSQVLKLNFRNSMSYKCDEGSSRYVLRRNTHRIHAKQKMGRKVDKQKEQHVSKDKTSTTHTNTTTNSSTNTLSLQFQKQFRSMVHQYHYVNASWAQQHSDTLPVSYLHQSQCFGHMNKRQFDQIIATARTVMGGGEETIDRDKYIYLRRVMLCVGEQIIGFLDAFMKFDEYGQFKREDMRKIMEVVMDRNNRSVDVIEQILWNWLIHNQIVEHDGVLLQHKMKESYKKNPLFHYMLISLIFGTNEKNAEQMVYEMISV